MGSGYTRTEGTPWHVFGGVLFSVLAGPVPAGIFWGVCMLLYQLYDSLPRACRDWQHTKWDVVETGFGALACGLVQEVARCLR